MTANQPILAVRDITKSFSHVTVLNQVSLEIYPTQILALLGENGAGKSTLMKVIAGIYQADHGTITHDGQIVKIESPTQAQRLGISMIHQELNLLPNRTVAQNIFLRSEPRLGGPLGWLGQVDIRRMNEDAERALARVGADIPVTHRVSRLTVAQQQMVEITKSLSKDVRVLLMDEPTSSLSEEQAESLLRLIRDLRDQGLAVVFTTHRLHEASEVADRFAVLRDGNLVATAAAAETKPEQVIHWMVGRPLNQLFPKPNIQPGETVLEVRGLSGGIVKDVSFSLRAGEILGFAGLVGAGRTNVARYLFGADRPAAGHIELRGKPVEVHSPVEAVRLGIGYVPEDRKLQSLILKLAVRQNAVLAGLARMSPHGVIRPRRIDETVAQYVRRLNIQLRSTRQKVRYLSGGNQQKVVLAKWLMLEPQVLILDEPTRGIDVGAKAEIYKLIGELAEMGIGVILISSEMPEILGLSDRIAVMSEGRLIKILERSEATQELIMTYASANRMLDREKVA